MRMDYESLQSDREMYFVLTQDICSNICALMVQANKTIYKAPHSFNYNLYP